MFPKRPTDNDLIIQSGAQEALKGANGTIVISHLKHNVNNLLRNPLALIYQPAIGGGALKGARKLTQFPQDPSKSPKKPLSLDLSNSYGGRVAQRGPGS